ncbi:MAG: AI-2E family transporter [Anaerolineae bacterium]|nr:AI-2E family transporter [Anaerolineae bacterium]
METPVHPSSQRFNLGSATKMLLILACAVVVLFGMREASGIIVPILLAFLLTIIFLPLQSFLIQKGLRPWLALVIVLLVMLLVIGGLLSLTIMSITQFINRIPQYQVPLQNIISTVEEWTTLLPIEVGSLLDLEIVNASQIVNLSVGILGGVLDILSNWALILVLVAFMLVDFALLPQKLERSFKKTGEVSGILNLIDSMRRYISITTWTGLLTGFVNAILLMILGVDFAILWGILAFVMNYIPNIGIIISIIPPAILAMLEFGWVRGLLVFIGFELINGIVENIIKPKAMEENLNISPLFVILSLLIWGFVLGPTGTILAIPLTIIVTKLLLERSEETAWLALLMTANPKLPRTPRLPKIKVPRQLRRFIRRSLRREGSVPNKENDAETPPNENGETSPSADHAE